MGKDWKSSSGRFTVTPPPSPRKFSSAVPEGASITNEELAWREIAQISKNISGLVQATNNQAKFVQQIPEIKMEVQQAKSEAARAHQAAELIDTKLSTEFNNLDRRVVRVEDRAHECFQTSAITELRDAALDTRRRAEEDRRGDVQVRERLVQAQAALVEVDEKIKADVGARRSVFAGLIGLMVFGLSSMGSLVWFLSELNAEVQAEQRERRDSYRRLEGRLEKVGRVADTAPVRRDLETLTKAVEEVGEDEAAERFCAALSDTAVQAMKRAVRRQDWPSCKRFGSEPP